MKNLLMATDLSARSDRALERAVGIARDRGAGLTVIHVVDEDLSPILADAQEQAARRALGEHIDSLRDDKGPDIAIEIVFGRAYADILALAEKTGAEMIVLGMHRDGGSREMFRGTTVERVIRTGRAPTLLVKDRVAQPYRRVMVAVRVPWLAVAVVDLHETDIAFREASGQKAAVGKMALAVGLTCGGRFPGDVECVRRGELHAIGCLHGGDPALQGPVGSSRGR